MTELWLWWWWNSEIIIKWWQSCDFKNDEIVKILWNDDIVVILKMMK